MLIGILTARRVSSILLILLSKLRFSTLLWYRRLLLRLGLRHGVLLLPIYVLRIRSLPLSSLGLLRIVPLTRVGSLRSESLSNFLSFCLRSFGSGGFLLGLFLCLLRCLDSIFSLLKLLLLDVHLGLPFVPLTHVLIEHLTVWVILVLRSPIFKLLFVVFVLFQIIGFFLLDILHGLVGNRC